MSKKKASKETKRLYDNSECSDKDPSSLSTSWQGRVCVLDPEKSVVAQKMGFSEKGEYAIKVR